MVRSHDLPAALFRRHKEVHEVGVRDTEDRLDPLGFEQLQNALIDFYWHGRISLGFFGRPRFYSALDKTDTVSLTSGDKTNPGFFISAPAFRKREPVLSGPRGSYFGSRLGTPNCM